MANLVRKLTEQNDHLNGYRQHQQQQQMEPHVKPKSIKNLLRPSLDCVTSRDPKEGLAAGLGERLRVVSPMMPIISIIMSLILPSLEALALDINYAGRLQETSGKSVDGPLDFTVKFYNDPNNGDVIGPTLKLANTELRDGVFQLGLSLDSSQMTALFGDGSKAVYIELEAGGRIYPRQRFMPVPLALRVPVDTNKFSYNSDGKLTIYSVDLNQVSGLKDALDKKADLSAINSGSSNNLADLTNSATARSNLGLGSLATSSAVGSAEITDGSIVNADINPSAAIAQSKISGLTTDLAAKEPTITAGTTTQFYRGDKSWQTFDTAARSAVSITAPLTYNSSTGVFGLGQSSGVADGYLSSSDFTAFNAKQAAITAASTVNAGTITTALQNGVQIKPYGIAAGNVGELRFNELAAGGTNYVGFKAPDTLAADRVWTLPAADGTGGQVLKTDGSGILSWVSIGGGGDMLAGNNLSDLTNKPAARTTLGLGALATLGAVGSTEITDGAIMNADVNASASITTSKLSGAVTSITGHGLGGLATLSAVGSTEITDGAIMDADINASAAIAQSKISGLSTSLSGKEPTITAGTTAQFYRGDKSWQTFDSAARSAVSITAPLTYNSGTGVFGLGQASGGSDGYLSSSDFTVFTNKQASISAATTVDAGTVTTTLQNGLQLKPFNTAAGNTGELRFNELAASGTNYVGFKAPDTLGADKIWTLPAADGTSGQVLKTDGSGTLGWVTGATGSVTSVNLTAPAAGITVSGAPITTSGSITLALGDDLAAVEGISTTGGVERTALNTWSTYTLTSAGKALIDDADASAQRTTLGLGSLATLSNVGSTEITNNSIMDTDINASAAIATSKLSGAVTSIASHGLGSLATASAVSGGTAGTITDDTITNADINSAAAIADTKLATISTAGKVSGSAITSGTIAGTTIFNTSGAITTSGTITGTGNIVVNGTGSATTELRFHDNDNSNYVTLKAPATVTSNVSFTLPAADGTSGQALTTSGTGTLAWSSIASTALITGTGGGAAPNPTSGCPTGYLTVPGDAAFSTTDFCVMKYEAKYGGQGAISQAIGNPAVNHDQGTAKASCRNLGPGYALINNNEWMTLATNIANVASNWSSGSVGSTALNRGHSDNVPANALPTVTDDNDPCNGTGQTCSASTWNDQRRTHNLSNGGVIWDLAGNLWEWVDYYNGSDKPTPATGAWYEFTAITGSTVMPKTMLVPTTAVKAWWNNAWNGATNGIGQMYPSAQGSGGGLLRGGALDNGTSSGVFAVTLSQVPASAGSGFGFRCVFRPSSL